MTYRPPHRRCPAGCAIAVRLLALAGPVFAQDPEPILPLTEGARALARCSALVDVSAFRQRSETYAGTRTAAPSELQQRSRAFLEAALRTELEAPTLDRWEARSVLEAYVRSLAMTRIADTRLRASDLDQACTSCAALLDEAPQAPETGVAYRFTGRISRRDAGLPDHLTLAPGLGIGDRVEGRFVLDPDAPVRASFRGGFFGAGASRLEVDGRALPITMMVAEADSLAVFFELPEQDLTSVFADSREFRLTNVSGILRLSGPGASTDGGTLPVHLERVAFDERAELSIMWDGRGPDGRERQFGQERLRILELRRE